VVLWITGAFQTLFSWRIEVLVGLIPIHLHLNKISRKYYLRVMFLPHQYALNSLLDKHYSKKASPIINVPSHTKTTSKIKSSIVDSNNYLNKVLSSFNKEFSLGFCLVDTFSDCFLFNIVNCKNMKAKTAHQNKLNKIFDDSISNPNTVIVISDANFKNNVATSSSYVHNDQNIIAKTIHHAINVTFTKVELFAIRHRINQVIQVSNVKQIIVIKCHSSYKIYF